MEFWPADVCEEFLPPHCPLEMDVRWIPYPLGTSSPQLEPPRALPSMGRVTEYALKGCKPGGGLSEGVLGILGPGRKRLLLCWLLEQHDWKVTSKLLDLTLSLAVSLGMVSGRQADCHPKELKEGFPYTWTLCLTLCFRAYRNSGTQSGRDSLPSRVLWVGLSGESIGRPWRNGPLPQARTYIWPSEFRRSVTKSTPMCDQGLWGTGRGTSLPAGR